MAVNASAYVPHVSCGAMPMHVTDDWLLERTGVHRSTVARWRSSGKYPPAVRRLAAIEHHGELELVCCHWQGWRLDAREGVLVSPEGERYTPGVIRALALRSQQLRALQTTPTPTRLERVWKLVLTLAPIIRGRIL